MRHGFGLLYQCNDISTATSTKCDTFLDHENTGKTITDMKKNQVTILAGKEDDT